MHERFEGAPAAIAVRGIGPCSESARPCSDAVEGVDIEQLLVPDYRQVLLDALGCSPLEHAL